MSSAPFQRFIAFDFISNVEFKTVVVGCLGLGRALFISTESRVNRHKCSNTQG